MQTIRGEVSLESNKVVSSFTLDVNAREGISIELDFGGVHDSNSDNFKSEPNSYDLNRLQTAQWGLIVDIQMLNAISSLKPCGDGPNEKGVYCNVLFDMFSNIEV